MGLLLPLSGRYAQEGETLLHAAQLALFDTADEGFLLLPRDTGGTASGAERAALALLEEGVDLILGPLFAEGVNAVTSHARAHGVTVVAFSTDRAAASEGVFLLGHTPRTQIRRVFAHAAANGTPTDRPVGARDTLWRDRGRRSLDSGSAQRTVARKESETTRRMRRTQPMSCATSPTTTGAPRP